MERKPDEVGSFEGREGGKTGRGEEKERGKREKSIQIPNQHAIEFL